jgi:hypothetical protein
MSGPRWTRYSPAGPSAPINARRSDAASSGAERIDEIAELRRGIDRRARESDPLGQRGIRGHDVDFLGPIVGADQPDNLVISRIRCGFGRVVDCDRR